MVKCIFCGTPTTAERSGFCLCSVCRAHTGALRADSPGYLWYMRAIRRALSELYPTNVRTR